MSTTWAPVPEGSLFGPENLPYGVFSTADAQPRVGVRVGDHVLDLAGVAASSAVEELHARSRPDCQAQPDHATGVAGYVSDLRDDLAQPSLNPLMAGGPRAWATVRRWLQGLLADPRQEDAAGAHLHPLADVRMHMPFEVADYVDFYASEHHATNVGRMFRPDDPPLLANWRHLPVGYHGRAGTVVVSGTDVVRPCGQRKAPDESAPTYGPSRRLDIEAEVGFVVGVGSPLGSRVPASAVADHVFGVVLLNDWSARDIQSWEYRPLGPFLGKSFATSISAWVTPLAALDAARVPPPRRTVPLLDYLADDPSEPWGLDLELRVDWNGTTVARPRLATVYWTVAQQLAHMTVTGASLRTGDLFASGTVSGPERDERGSFLELSWNGSQPVRLADGTIRTFLEDGDTVTLGATAPGPAGARIGFGEVTGRILPAR